MAKQGKSGVAGEIAGAVVIGILGGPISAVICIAGSATQSSGTRTSTGKGRFSPENEIDLWLPDCIGDDPNP